MVLWPKEKNNPHVTGNWPKFIKPRVALSIALRRLNSVNTVHYYKELYSAQGPEIIITYIREWKVT
jgi:hypothetical protein